MICPLADILAHVQYPMFPNAMIGANKTGNVDERYTPPPNMPATIYLPVPDMATAFQ